MRAVAAIVAGLVVGFAGMIAVALAGGMIFPMPGSIDVTNAEQVKGAFTDLPQGAKAAVILSWFIGALLGSLVAKLIARRGWAAWTIAGLFAVYVLLNVLVLPMPGWMQAMAVAAPLFGGLIANHLVRDRAVAGAQEPPTGA